MMFSAPLDDETEETIMTLLEAAGAGLDVQAPLDALRERIRQRDAKPPAPLCGAPYWREGVSCTRPRKHEGEHMAKGPQVLTWGTAGFVDRHPILG